MHTLQGRINTGLLVFIALTGMVLVAMMASRVYGGPLDPSGPPASTMKTLDDIPPSWHRVLAANDGIDSCHSSRFLCVGPVEQFVLDRGTGLVWELVPNTTPKDWLGAEFECHLRGGNQFTGFRLPTIEELQSILYQIPIGHPFSGPEPQPAVYWSLSTDPADTAKAYIMTADGAFGSQAKTVVNGIGWCVRGGSGYDGY